MFQISNAETTSPTSNSDNQFITRLCLKLSSANLNACVTWLDGVTKLLGNKAPPDLSCELLCVVCSLFLVRSEEDVARRAMTVLCEMAKLDHAQVRYRLS